DTFQPMSVCDPVGGMHALWTGVLPVQVFADAPPDGFDAPVDDAYLRHLADVVERHAGELAAVIVEPVVQGAGGMRFHHPAYVRRIEKGLDAGLEPLRGAPAVADVRVLGAIGVVQLDHPVGMAAATAAAVAAGVWLRPFRDLIYTMPPYVTDDADVARICRG